MYSRVAKPPPLLYIDYRGVDLPPVVTILPNVTDRDLEIDRDMEHESNTDYPLINKRYLNNEHSN